MKASEIQVGKTYRNRGAGRTQRKVLAIGDDHRPRSWHGASPRPDEPGVLYEQDGKQQKLMLSSFAAWAGAEV
jgi:hypothetical protein